MTEVFWDDDGLMTALRPRPATWQPPDTSSSLCRWAGGELSLQMAHAATHLAWHAVSACWLGIGECALTAACRLEQCLAAGITTPACCPELSHVRTLPVDMRSLTPGKSICFSLGPANPFLPSRLSPVLQSHKQ